MDIAAIPRAHGMDVDKWAHLVGQQGVLFYDSKMGDAPTLQPENTDIKMYDVQEEDDLKVMEQELKDLEGPLDPIILEEKIPDPTSDSISEPLRSNQIDLGNTGGAVLTYSDGTDVTMAATTTDSGNFIGYNTSDVITDASGARLTLREETPINPVVSMTPEEVQEFTQNWEAQGSAPLSVGSTPEPPTTRRQRRSSRRGPSIPGFNLIDDTV